MQASLAVDSSVIPTPDEAMFAASGKAKSDLDDTMPALRRQRDSFVSDFHSIDNETASTWDATRARLEKEWTQLKTAVDKAA